MKKHLYFILFFYALLPITAMSQCTCSGGAPADSVVHRYTLGVNSSPNIIISFPRFDPALGTLACLVYKDTLSAVSTTHVRNLDSADQEYSFRLTVNNMITAPGISVNAYMDKYYGPDSLKAYGKGRDSIVFGPDTTFRKVTHSITKSTVLAPFMGSGNVDFNYGISGGLISMAGGLNFSQRIESSRWGSFKLTYYYCSSSVLASNIQNLLVNKKDKTVSITWNTTNQSNTYEIEISTDGKNFTTVGKGKQASASGSASAKYEYQYNTDQATTGTLYFRVKETDAQGKVSYSKTSIILLDNEAPAVLYPNPAVNGVNVQLNKFVQGEIEVALVNAVGQTVFKRLYRLDKLNNINVQWPVSVKQGVYYLKVKDLQTQSLSISKLFVK
jgi:hypothetical protein